MKPSQVATVSSQKTHCWGWHVNDTNSTCIIAARRHYQSRQFKTKDQKHKCGHCVNSEDTMLGMAHK